MDAALNTWLNAAVILVIAGAVCYLSCLRSTTWFDDKESE